MFLILLAALSNVDRSQIEAAEIDGASYGRIFFRIVLPAIFPVMMIAVLIRALDLFRLFDIVWALGAAPAPGPRPSRSMPTFRASSSSTSATPRPLPSSSSCSCRWR